MEDTKFLEYSVACSTSVLTALNFLAGSSRSGSNVSVFTVYGYKVRYDASHRAGYKPLMRILMTIFRA